MSSRVGLGSSVTTSSSFLWCSFSSFFLFSSSVFFLDSATTGFSSSYSYIFPSGPPLPPSSLPTSLASSVAYFATLLPPAPPPGFPMTPPSSHHSLLSVCALMVLHIPLLALLLLIFLFSSLLSPTTCSSYFPPTLSAPAPPHCFAPAPLTSAHTVVSWSVPSVPSCSAPSFSSVAPLAPYFAPAFSLARTTYSLQEFLQQASRVSYVSHLPGSPPSEEHALLSTPHRYCLAKRSSWLH